MIEGFMRKEQKEQNNIIATAWHCERFARTKKLQDLKEYLILEDNETPEQVQTPENMLGVCKMLNAALGGNVVEA